MHVTFLLLRLSGRNPSTSPHLRTQQIPPPFKALTEPPRVPGAEPKHAAERTGRERHATARLPRAAKGEEGPRRDFQPRRSRVPRPSCTASSHFPPPLPVPQGRLGRLPRGDAHRPPPGRPSASFSPKKPQKLTSARSPGEPASPQRVCSRPTSPRSLLRARAAGGLEAVSTLRLGVLFYFYFARFPCCSGLSPHTWHEALLPLLRAPLPSGAHGRRRAAAEPFPCKTHRRSSRLTSSGFPLAFLVVIP